MDRQCLLFKDGWQRIAWIPKSLAIVNNLVEVKNEKNWTVIQVYISPFEDKWMKNKELNNSRTIVDWD